MYCDACGAQVAHEQKFCSVCGKGMGAVAVVRAAGPGTRAAAHLRVLAALWIARAVLCLIPAVVFLSKTHWRLPGQWQVDYSDFLHPLFNGIGWILLVLAGVCLVAAWGLLERAPWARLYTIVMGAISLMEVPFGTALGIYSLWVLLPESSETEYREMAANG